MNVALRRSRRSPSTLIGRLIRVWPQIKLALRFLRFVRRTRRVLRVLALSAIGGAVFSLVRRMRRRREVTTGPTYSPPPATPAGYSGGTRETGYEAGPGTQTERELAAEKGATNGGGPAAGVDEPPPVAQEPPSKT